MNLGDFLKLVPLIIYNYSLSNGPHEQRYCIPLTDFIEALEKNRLLIMSEEELCMEYVKGRIDQGKSEPQSSTPKAKNDE